MAKKKAAKKKAVKKAVAKKKVVKKKVVKKKVVKKKAVKKKAAKKKAAPQNKLIHPLDPKKGQVVIRIYRQGLGDCYLLAFGGEKTRYVLIDCGVHMRQTDGNRRLEQVMQNVIAVTANRLDVVVATHEHADHLSGFVQKNSPFLKDDVEIENVWLAWTENRKDRQANELRMKHGIAREILKKAVQELRLRANQDPSLTNLADAAEDGVSFEEIPPESINEHEVVAAIKALAKANPQRARMFDPLLESEPDQPASFLGAAKKPKTKPSSNELAIGLLMVKGEPKFCKPGDVVEIPDLGNVRAYVLGPPKSELLKKDRPSKIRGKHEYKETYLSGLEGGQSFALSPALGASPLGLSEDFRYPFAPMFYRDMEELPKHRHVSRYNEDRESWRRVDGDWLNAAEQLALNLDSDTNNTSLVLAFELGEPGEGPVLLFPGDAQVGNWLSWRDQLYGANGKTFDADDLMARTRFYKVGHHGSHNATVKRDPREASPGDELGVPFGLELMRDIIAAIPVDRAAADKDMPRPWSMPHQPLYERLREKANRRVLRGDQSIAPLISGQAEPDIVPTPRSDRDGWSAVPGLPGHKWRQAKEMFEHGTKGPLYYDVLVPFE